MIRTLLVDYSARFLDLFVSLLEREPDMEVVARAGSLAEARGNLSGVDVAIIDRGLPDGDGLELISEVHEASPAAAVLVISATVEHAHPREALEAGAAEVVDKIAPPEEIISAIRRVAGG